MKTKEKAPGPAARPDWPASKVELRPIGDLVPYVRNARTHSDAQVDQIVASMHEFGWTIPVLVDERGMLIAGHGRVLAAHKLGVTRVPCMTAVGWTEPQKRAYVLADNQLALNAGWNTELVKVELAELGEAGFNVALTGFGEHDLSGAKPVDRSEKAAEGDTGGPWLRIADRKVKITEAEKAALERALDAYVERFGSNFGFPSHIAESRQTLSEAA